jgi:RNA-directed DNA polymerase
MDGKYNGIIRILADPAYLQFCYMLIKSKPGNMSRGLTKETLDGISYSWFEETAKSLLTGKYEFTPSRRVLIPKPGKITKRPLGISSPREKIVHKGLQIILEQIYEPKFLDCSHGFRPHRSTHSALRMLYLKGNQFT